MDTNSIIGYRVQTNDGRFVNYDGRSYHWVASPDSVQPEPLSRPDAYRRLAAYIEQCPDAAVPSVVPVYYTPTPLEKASNELGGLLTSLCARHGLDLGMTREQINTQIAGELAALQAGGPTFFATSVPRTGR